MKFLLAGLILSSWLSASPLARALQLEGVAVPGSVEVDGQSLALNGAGVRVVKLAFIPVKAYVAAFFAPAALRSENDVLASPGPLRFEFTFLQGVGQAQVTEAWQAQFKASTDFTYPGLAADQARFIALFGPLKKFGQEAVEISGTETRVYDGGVLRGTIEGRNFQKAFLSLWFGARPVQDSLKTALLGK